MGSPSRAFHVAPASWLSQSPQSSEFSVRGQKEDTGDKMGTL